MCGPVISQGSIAWYVFQLGFRKAKEFFPHRAGKVHRSHYKFIIGLTYLKGGVTCDMADNPVTTVQNCVSTFASVKPLDIFKGETFYTHFSVHRFILGYH